MFLLCLFQHAHTPAMFTVLTRLLLHVLFHLICVSFGGISCISCVNSNPKPRKIFNKFKLTRMIINNMPLHLSNYYGTVLYLNRNEYMIMNIQWFPTNISWIFSDFQQTFLGVDLRWVDESVNDAWFVVFNAISYVLLIVLKVWAVCNS